MTECNTGDVVLLPFPFGNIYTVDKRLVREKIGSFGKSTIRAIQSGIHKIISL